MDTEKTSVNAQSPNIRSRCLPFFDRSVGTLHELLNTQRSRLKLRTITVTLSVSALVVVFLGLCLASNEAYAWKGTRSKKIKRIKKTSTVNRTPKPTTKNARLAPPSKELLDKATPHVLNALNHGVISSRDAKDLQAKLGVGAEREWMAVLANVAGGFAQIPGTKNAIGAVGKIRGTGEYVIGFNLEFNQHEPSQAVHAEQAVVALAHKNKLGPLESIYVTASPCGNCRQFLMETFSGGNMRVYIEGYAPMALSRLLKMPYRGPYGLLKQQPTPQKLVRTSMADKHNKPLKWAVEAAATSYIRNKPRHSGIALETKAGQIYTGANIEISAKKSTLPPLHYALLGMALDRVSFKDIRQAFLVESKGLVFSNAATTKMLLKTIAPGATLNVRMIKSE